MRRNTALVLALSAIALVPVSTRASSRAISSDEFLARVARAREAAVAGSHDPTRARMESVRASLGLPVAVEFPAGTIDLPEDPILAPLTGARAADFRVARTHLDALRDGTLETREAAVLPESTLRAALAPAFRGVRTQPTLWERASAVLARVLDAIGRGVSAAADAVSRGSLLFLVAILGAVAIALWRIAFRKGGLVPERSARAHGRAEMDDPQRALEEALKAGDLDGAVRAQYRLLLHALAARGFVPDEPSLTAGECRSAVAVSRRALYPLVADATTAFERVAYGHTSPRDAHLDVLRRATNAARAA